MNKWKSVVLQVFFLFSSTKVGHSRPPVKNRCAISDKNILRSYVVRYFYLKFLACRSSAPCEMYKNKGKKWGGRCVEAVYSATFDNLLALNLSLRIEIPNALSILYSVSRERFSCPFNILDIYCRLQLIFSAS